MNEPLLTGCPSQHNAPNSKKGKFINRLLWKCNLLPKWVTVGWLRMSWMPPLRTAVKLSVEGGRVFVTGNLPQDDFSSLLFLPCFDRDFVCSLSFCWLRRISLPIPSVCRDTMHTYEILTGTVFLDRSVRWFFLWPFAAHSSLSYIRPFHRHSKGACPPGPLRSTLRTAVGKLLKWH